MHSITSSLFRAAWIGQFAEYLEQLGVDAAPAEVADAAGEFWRLAGDEDPRDAAELVWAGWAPEGD